MTETRSKDRSIIQKHFSPSATDLEGSLRARAVQFDGKILFSIANKYFQVVKASAVSADVEAQSLCKC